MLKDTTWHFTDVKCQLSKCLYLRSRLTRASFTTFTVCFDLPAIVHLWLLCKKKNLTTNISTNVEVFDQNLNECRTRSKKSKIDQNLNECRTIPSKSCRFCKKNVTSQGTKVPRVSLFKITRNSLLLACTYRRDEYLILADVVDSFGFKLVRNEKRSDVSCLACARILARIHGTFKKVTAQVNNGVTETARPKRISRNSPNGIFPAAKRTRAHWSTSSVRRSLAQMSTGIKIL